MSKRRGGILPAIALGTGLLAAMLPAQSLAAIPEGPFESHHVKTVEAGGERGAAITSTGRCGYGAPTTWANWAMAPLKIASSRSR